MITERETVIENSGKCFHKKCFSWSAILIGTLVGLGLSFLLNVFSIAIGLTAFTLKESATVFAVGGFIGFAIGVFAAMFVAGFTAGHLARPYCLKRNLGVLYGFATWSLILVFSILLSAPVAKFVTSYSYFITDNSVNIVRTMNAPAVTTAATTTPEANKAVAVDAEKSANDIGKAGLAVFFLFFLGAFASSLGGYYGVACRCKDEDYPVDK